MNFKVGRITASSIVSLQGDIVPVPRYGLLCRGCFAVSILAVMLRTISKITLTAVLGVGLLPADFSYEQTTTITGGALAGMIKFAGKFSKQAREPQRYTVAVK